jgi:glyoxylase-like metal-dependent hydrolase (beta-lactamase superfamily II)
MDELKPHQLAPGVYRLAGAVSNAYLWQWSEGLTLIDTGVPGSAHAILGAIAAIGAHPEDVTEIVLTHFHADHTGSVAELARRTGASVLAHRADAVIIRGHQPPVPPDLTELERPLAEALFGDLSTLPGPQPPPVDVTREVDDGDATAGGGTIVGVPGHTPGSVALLVPQLGVLFTGDTIASYEGAPILGPFNINRPGAIEAVRKQAGLEFDIACGGHGEPIVGGANRKVLAMIRSF